MAETTRGLLLDLDGVLYTGDNAIPGAADTVAWLQRSGVPHLFLTNTTSRPRAALVEKLAGFGVDTDVEHLLTPPAAAVQWLEERGVQRVAALVPEATRGEFAAFDDAMDSDGSAPEAVIVGDLGAAWTWELLNQAFRWLMADPPPALLALGMTRYWRADDGLRLDTAPFVVALAHASGRTPIVLGKPDEHFFHAALARLGTAAGDTWMIGDDIQADVGGAQRAGLHGLLVRTGKYQGQDCADDVHPDAVLDSLADLRGWWHL